jgi:hypothetical protein
LAESASCLPQPDHVRVRELWCKLRSDAQRVGNPLELFDVGDDEVMSIGV